MIATKHVHRDAEVPGKNLNQNVTDCRQRQGSQQLRRTKSDLTSNLNEDMLGVMITVLDVTWRHAAACSFCGRVR